jgi:hypothetical protein
MAKSASIRSPAVSPALSAEEQALAVALQLMRPYARLMVAQGLKFGAAAEVLKRAFVEMATAEIELAGAVGNVSRISISTGIHRQDVKRLLDTPSGALDRGRSLASEIYVRWMTDSTYRSRGKPRVLPFRAPKGKLSFETLARTVSTDVHPRTLFEELKRLGLVEVDEAGETLQLSMSGFVPINERAAMLGLLGDNVSDHFAAAVGNVLGDTPRRLEQAVYADGLDADGLMQVDARTRDIWQQNIQMLVPLLRALVKGKGKTQNKKSQRLNSGKVGAPPQRNRVRVGIYMHTESLNPAPPERAVGTRKKVRD